MPIGTDYAKLRVNTILKRLFNRIFLWIFIVFFVV